MGLALLIPSSWACGKRLNVKTRGRFTPYRWMCILAPTFYLFPESVQGICFQIFYVQDEESCQKTLFILHYFFPCFFFPFSIFPFTSKVARPCLPCYCFKVSRFYCGWSLSSCYWIKPKEAGRIWIKKVKLWHSLSLQTAYFPQQLFCFHQRRIHIWHIRFCTRDREWFIV